LRSGENLGAIGIDDFIGQTSQVIASRSLELRP
jgi:hypothetical protein